jgi:alpha-mannosidase
MSLPTALFAAAGLGRLTPAEWRAAFTARAALLAAPLPANVHLLTAHDLGGGSLLLRLAHLFDAGEHASLSADASVDLATMLAGGRAISACVDMTMPGALELGKVPPRTYVTDGGRAVRSPQLPAPPAGEALTIVLRAQEIRTLRCTLS